jgi:hypothetical protein
MTMWSDDTITGVGAAAPAPTDLAKRYGMSGLSCDPNLLSTTQTASTAYTSGTGYFTLIRDYPAVSISQLWRYFGTTGWTATSLGLVVYSSNGNSAAPPTTWTKVGTIDYGTAGTAGVANPSLTVSGLTAGNHLAVMFLHVGATAGTMRALVGMQAAGSTAGVNFGLADAGVQNWFTSSAATGLANVAAAPATVALSTCSSPTAVGGPLCIGVKA